MPVMAVVMIGVDPHKASHTAVAINAAEEPLGQVRVRASAVQAERLLAWAQAWPDRSWAVEGAGGAGHLLAQQLLSAGERVLDVPPKLAARVRLLATGDINKNDPNDARSVAVAALRSAGVREARRDDHAAVLKVWSKRYGDLGRVRTQVACRLHQVLCELTPGGVRGEITAGQAARILASITPAGAVEAARCHIAAVTQIRYQHSPGRAYYDKKLADGKTRKEALRCLKRQISDAIFACLQADARRTAACAKSPGGQPGNHSSSRAAGSHPDHRRFGQATPGPATHPTTPAGADTAAPFPALLPSRASRRTGRGPGAARPRSGARRASSTRPPASR